MSFGPLIRKLLDLGGQLRSVQAEKSELEERWLALAEEIHESARRFAPMATQSSCADCGHAARGWNKMPLRPHARTRRRAITKHRPRPPT
jgi:hypothetical protein